MEDGEMQRLLLSAMLLSINKYCYLLVEKELRKIGMKDPFYELSAVRS